MVNIVNPIHNIPEDIVKKYYFSEFILQMKSEWLTLDTMKFYISFIWLFVRSCKFESPTDFDNLIKIKFGYLSLFEGKHAEISNSTRLKYHISIKKYTEFLKDMEIITNIHISKMKKPKLGKSIPKAMDEDSLEKLYTALMTYNSYNKFYNMRNYVMIEVMVYTGMRRKEVANLRIENCKKDHIIIREGKWQKDRMIPLPKKTQDTINWWLEIRKDLPGETVFCTSDGGELQSRAISDVFNRISRTLGMNVHPHLLRHSYASLCVKKGVNIYSIQQAMGHADIKTTSIYFHMGMKDQVNEMQKLNY